MTFSGELLGLVFGLREAFWGILIFLGPEVWVVFDIFIVIDRF